MSLDELSARFFYLVRNRLSASESAIVEDAYKVASEAHEGRERKQGGPFFIHPLRVANSLIEEFDTVSADVIAAALLHDVLEDAPDRVSFADIQTRFGESIAELVNGLTYSSNARPIDKQEAARQKFEKVRRSRPEAWFIKLADRIDNLRDASRLDDSLENRSFRIRYEAETKKYYVPLANELDDKKVFEALSRALAELQERVVADQLH